MFFKSFSHIYVEERILEHPNTVRILEKFPNAIQIKTKHYKNVFNAKSQDFRSQKNSTKLILAKKEDQFLYPGSGFSPSFGAENFYYNTLALNCIYDCEYCYLQGMYSSANLVIFVNTEDFFTATKDFLEKHKSLYLCISYETDLLALESILGYCKEWIEFGGRNENLTLELRTKSTSFSQISHLKPNSNTILAWSLNPMPIWKEWEKKTPSPLARMKSMTEAIEKGWRVRLCLDPLLFLPEWKEVYSEFIQTLKAEVPLDKIPEICLGVFRINADFLQKMRSENENSALLWYPFNISNRVASYGDKQEQTMKEFVAGLLLESGYLNKIVFC